jgi:hypothetical protein
MPRPPAKIAKGSLALLVQLVDGFCDNLHLIEVTMQKYK